MKHLNMDLQLFAGSLTVTVYKDSGITTATASPSSSLAEGDQVTLTITPASGYEVKEYICLAGGVTVDPATKKFTMGEASVTLCVTSKDATTYKVVENCYTNVNGTVVELKRNMKLVKGANGAIIGVDCNGTDLGDLNADVVKQLVAAGVLVKI